VCVLKAVQQITGTAVLGQQRKFERAEVLTLVNDRDGTHQRTQDQFDVVLEVIDLYQKVKVQVLRGTNPFDLG